MAELINLRTVRKRAKRERDASRAEAQRHAHGQPKRLRKLSAAQKAKSERNLDQHRIETGDGR
jgi:Domain of unknown function (DUF4169)